MATFHVKNSQIDGKNIQIIGEDYNHLKNVLRSKIGEKIDICDENSIKYNTKIIEYTDKAAVCEIEKIDDRNTETKVKMTLFQGLPKMDKFELIIQKSTEIGVSDIYPVQMDRSIMKIDEKNLDKKLDRWNKISLEASKQSGRQKIPNVHTVINLKNIIENISKYDIVLLPYENEKSATIKDVIGDLKSNKEEFKNIAVIIGPEGGFSENEISTLSKYENVNIVTLGPRILRTETAGIVTLAMLVYEFEL